MCRPHRKMKVRFQPRCHPAPKGVARIAQFLHSYVVYHLPSAYQMLLRGTSQYQLLVRTAPTLMMTAIRKLTALLSSTPRPLSRLRLAPSRILFAAAFSESCSSCPAPSPASNALLVPDPLPPVTCRDSSVFSPAFFLKDGDRDVVTRTCRLSTLHENQIGRDECRIREM